MKVIRKNVVWVMAAVMLLGACSVNAETPSEYGGVRGVSLLGEKPLEFIKPFRNTDKFTVTHFQVEDQEFKDAIRVEILERVPAVWDMQLRAPCPVPLKKGDVLHLTYWMRGVKIDSEFAETTALNAMQLDRVPWTDIFRFRPRAKLGEGWVKYQKVVVVKADYAANEYAFNFQFGFDPQIFEIGGLSLYNYGSEIDPAILPTIKEKLYAGCESDAPWRKKALERIEKIRKGNLTIVVQDKDGKPVPNAEVKVEMQKHDFGWGTALNVGGFVSNKPEDKLYREKFLELFNLMVPENGLKMPAWENPERQKNTLKMIDWAIENGCQVRGHTLVWPSFRRNPARLRELKDNPEALREEIRKHIKDIMAKTKGKLRCWDVMNEPTTNYEFMEILGWDEVAEWYKLARECDSKPQLFLNENQIIAGTKLRNFELNADRIIAGGGELGGLGIQGHISVGTESPEKILEIFDRLSCYNVPLSITELDINSHNLEEQGLYLRDILITSFSHPSIDSVTFWGFWDGRHWLNNTPLFAKDWSEKPGLKHYRKLVFDDWWTKETKQTDAQGRAAVRCFYGDYKITVNGEIKTFSFPKEKGEMTVLIEL